MIRVCVVDDEPIAGRKIQRLLKEDPEIEIAGIFTNGEDALEGISKLNPDLIFLDIQMPGLDGFEVLKSLDPEKLPQVIFVTAYDHYAIRAFEVHALDYLLKPFDRKRFHEALQRSKTQIHLDRDSSISREMRALIKEITNKPKYLERLVIKNRGKIVFLKTALIDWIEAQGKYEVVHVGTESHLIREGMGKLESELDPQKFVRIHKSTIVNIDRMQHLQPLFHGDFRLVLRDGTPLTISRRYREKLETTLGKNL